jgi:hypothetical protein
MILPLDTGRIRDERETPPNLPRKREMNKLGVKRALSDTRAKP